MCMFFHSCTWGVVRCMNWLQPWHMNIIASPNVWVLKKCHVLVTQLCLTLCNPMDCSPPGSSVHGILQARILEWVAIRFFRGSSWPRDRTQVSHIAGRYFIIWATWEAHGFVFTLFYFCSSCWGHMLTFWWIAFMIPMWNLPAFGVCMNSVVLWAFSP